ncbi:hypothetical protein AB5J72_01760 [Streptomyces sp. CG1]|uniref:hypothetical protein n=1 Tax=Streptomyces sp. CG1 TaxID=1287523 RepID=UPI0034E19F79
MPLAAQPADLRSLQPDIDVEVTIRLWDFHPAPLAGAEGQLGISLESEIGILVVNQVDQPPGDS